MKHNRKRFIDLSHTIEHGMTTYPGLPGPIMCDFLSREASREFYAPGTEFQIGRIELVGNTGTYVDSPFHRFADGKCLAQLPLESLAEIPALVVQPRRVWQEHSCAIEARDLADVDCEGRAVLVHTGWDRHWGTGTYLQGPHPFLTEDAAELLRNRGAVLVGIDSLNIDSLADKRRPVHTVLLGAEIPVCEHLTGLGQLPVNDNFTFSAVPVKVKAFGTFPVRAYGVV